MSCCCEFYERKRFLWSKLSCIGFLRFHACHLNSAVNKSAIIVPAIGDQQVVDETLISVLENRPNGTRVLVPCDVDYEDQYDLADEVDFLRCDLSRELGSSMWTKRPVIAWTSLANEALYSAQHSYVGLILPGASMLPGSMDAITEVFESRPDIASIVPMLFEPDNEDVTVGVAMSSGTRVAVMQSRQDRYEKQLVGASLMAGFYRTSALLDIGGWNTNVHTQVADIDLSMRLYEAGYEIQQTPFSRMELNVHPDLNFDRYRLNRDSQLIHRQIRRIEGKASRLRPLRLLGEFFANLGSGSVSGLMGRVSGAYGKLPSPTRTSQHDQLDRLAA